MKLSHSVLEPDQYHIIGFAMFFRLFVTEFGKLVRSASGLNVILMDLLNLSLPYLSSLSRYCVRVCQSSGVHEWIVPPYLVPGAGHGLSLILNPERFLRGLQ